MAAVGITNQRETTVVWERASGRPLCNAIVWQCRRTAPMCEQMRRRGLEPLVRERTGLIIDAYFSATKLRWILDHVPGAGPLNGGARDLRGLTEAAGAETREVTAHLQEVAMKLALVAAGQRLPGRVMSGLL